MNRLTQNRKEKGTGNRLLLKGLPVSSIPFRKNHRSTGYYINIELGTAITRANDNQFIDTEIELNFIGLGNCILD